MADFLTAYNRTAVNEGGYVNDPDDRGGETWRGIARTRNPQWQGWKIIDELKKRPGFPKILDSHKGLKTLELSFYKATYWDKVRGDELKWQEIANDLYDKAVNKGHSKAIELAQIAAGIAVTKVMDSLTLKTLNK